jgi:general secretion pathway protein I
MRHLARRRLAGFTLLEVMVAVAILALAIVAIFASQAGALRVGMRAERITTATLLARCKMGEIEEQVATDGLPAVDDDGEDGCCEDGEMEGFTCVWRIERIVLPDVVDADGDGTTAAGGVAAPGAPGAEPPPISATSSIGGNDMLSAGVDPGALEGMALELAFPIMRPAIEESVRRAEVTVRWPEGNETEEFTVVQFLVADQGLGISGVPDDPGAATSDTTTTTTPGSATGQRQPSPTTGATR